MGSNEMSEVNETNQRELASSSISEQEKELYEKVSNILKDINITPSLKGYYYLREAIVLIYKEPKYKRGMMEGLFSDIANKFNENSAKNVYRCISTAIEKAYKTTFAETIYKYFKKIPPKRKLSPNKAIIALVNYINLD